MWMWEGSDRLEILFRVLNRIWTEKLKVVVKVRKISESSVSPCWGKDEAEIRIR